MGMEPRPGQVTHLLKRGAVPRLVAMKMFPPQLSDCRSAHGGNIHRRVPPPRSALMPAGTSPTIFSGTPPIPGSPRTALAIADPLRPAMPPMMITTAGMCSATGRHMSGPSPWASWVACTAVTPTLPRARMSVATVASPAGANTSAVRPVVGVMAAVASDAASAMDCSSRK